MNEKNLQEIAYRRQAFKLFDKGKSTKQILHHIPRSRSWLFKWKHRFATAGWQALDSLSHAPQTSPQQYDPSVVQLVLRVRRRMERATVGLVGGRAVFFELKQKALVTEIPSVSTIKRWLRAAGCFEKKEAQQTVAYYPAPHFTSEVCYVACDWVARYLEGGVKVFVFHTLDLQTHALAQSIATTKSTPVACAHLLHSASELGVIDFLQLDNDAAFTGLGKKGRIFGRFVRLALYLGIELVFIPPGEPKRNSLVERVNGLWVSSFWDKDHFSSVREVKRKSRQFHAWYQNYAPPALAGLSVREANRQPRGRKLSHAEMADLPAELPLCEGRIHFVRRVNPDGKIEILKEYWRVSKQLRGKYVWAVVETKQQRLRIYHRHSARAEAKLVKEYAYQIGERVEKLAHGYRRASRRVRVPQII